MGDYLILLLLYLGMIMWYTYLWVERVIEVRKSNLEQSTITPELRKRGFALVLTGLTMILYTIN